MSDAPPNWDERYAEQNTPWDTGNPSTELQRILGEFDVPRARALELGCGTGTNAIFLAQQGFEVTAVDISSLAIEKAQGKAAQAGVDVALLAADLANMSDIGPPFSFVFDRGVYHTCRRDNLNGFVETLRKTLAPGGLYLTIAGNANEVRPNEEGPPRVTVEEIARELASWLDLVQLREMRFDRAIIDGHPERPLGWSALFRRRAEE